MEKTSAVSAVSALSFPMLARSLFAALVLAALASAASAQEVRGRWFTEPDAALAEARKAGRPVLAVAMDHA
ncbi:MAG: hypothetical protein MUC63_10265 [Planctomycetes bacterium]|jgi:hypothetical protein|nr:hypothetical protein [Planctomycetota bacterium]